MGFSSVLEGELMLRRVSGRLSFKQHCAFGSKSVVFLSGVSLVVAPCLSLLETGKV